MPKGKGYKRGKVTYKTPKGKTKKIKPLKKSKNNVESMGKEYMKNKKGR